MRDPIPIYKPLSDFVRPYATALNLNTLHLHIHEVLGAFITYHLVYLLSPYISSWLFPKYYPSFNRRTKINWDVHVVSLVQSTFISLFALFVFWFDKERAETEHRVYGYTGIGGALQACATGYFLWDLMMSARYLDIFGPGFLGHAASATVVYGLGFRPFVNWYAPVFVAFEYSSPFLNFHWFFDKVGMTGSRAQWYNGMVLLGVFFGCRVIYGPLSSYRVFSDVFRAAYNDDPILTAQQGRVPVPLWLGYTYLTSNTILNFLNMFWFTKMIGTVLKRFQAPKEKKGEKAEILAKVSEVSEMGDVPVPTHLPNGAAKELKRRK